ncbi:MAG: precorrin-6A/cobalt-precorrin-6A reductase [Paracoccaceae bacterium]|nr:precorrin-6A/cobalt-precorrin-6A reductase [Paracoccaceae bacterium]
MTAADLDQGQGVLIVGGSLEAWQLARHLPRATVRLAEPERVARVWANPLSVGPVTAEWLESEAPRVVIEAAHPCDTQTAFATARACAAAGLPRLQLVRPAWRPTRRDRWVPLRVAEEAPLVIPRGARVLVATGGQGLPVLRALRVFALVRLLRPHHGGYPPGIGRFLPGEGPFEPAQEARLLCKERIDWLLVPNAGGSGGKPKLQAARQLGLPVAMIDRPRRPDGPRVQTVKEALAWLTRQTA